MPVVISFTVETDGRLPTGQTLKEAIERDRRRDRPRAGLLHDQLRAPDALRGRARRRASRGSSGCAACAPTPRRAAMPSSTPATDLDAGDPVELGRAVPRPAPQLAATSPCSAAAAAPTTATSSRSALPARRKMCARWREASGRAGKGRDTTPVRIRTAWPRRARRRPLATTQHRWRARRRAPCARALLCPPYEIHPMPSSR